MQDCKVITQDVKNRISRIKGQVEGIEKMINSDRPCNDVLVQVQAAKNALSKLGIELLKKESKDCFNYNGKDSKVKSEELENIVEQLFKLSN